MRAKTGTVALSAAVALLLAGCTAKTVAGHGEPALAPVAGSSGAAVSGSPSAGAGAGTSAAAAGGAGRTTADLQGALLTINDLAGSGWAIDNSADDSDDSSDDDSCGPDDPGDAAHEAGIDFSQGDLGPFLDEQLFSASSAAAAKDAYSTIVASIAACSGQTESDGSSATIADMSFPKFGDQSRGYRVTETVPDASTSPGDDSVSQTIPIDVIIVQDGSLLEEFSYVDLSGGGLAGLPTSVKNGVTRAHSLR